ncbi:hypothetical protein HDU76_003915 [Blyttiomyces sp. JEL0837]|nr:hypothetical protein HDU76_003915 [Blyttiomyces sp. JEL0837]
MGAPTPLYNAVLRLVLGIAALYVFEKVAKRLTKLVLIKVFGLSASGTSPSAIIKKLKKAQSAGSLKKSSLESTTGTATTQTPYRLPKWQVPMITDMVVYFGIAFIAVDSLPRLFKGLGI